MLKFGFMLSFSSETIVRGHRKHFFKYILFLFHRTLVLLFQFFCVVELPTELLMENFNQSGGYGAWAAMNVPLK